MTEPAEVEKTGTAKELGGKPSLTVAAKAALVVVVGKSNGDASIFSSDL